ncbi:MAG: hypothetical protein NTW30_05640 [Candidatus Aenigmarchaeota archaeon]|nr:hypothetical protein [Candidatus Aenigmarchaeota archaeon]
MEETVENYKASKKQLLNYTIYLFKKGRVLYGIAKAPLDNLETEVTFGQGFKLIKDKNSKLNTPAVIYKRAKRSVVASLSNSLNAIQMFGEDILTNEGEIDWEKFQMEEFKRAFELAKLKTKKYDKKVYDFKIIEIPLEIAQLNELI